MEKPSINRSDLPTVPELVREQHSSSQQELVSTISALIEKLKDQVVLTANIIDRFNNREEPRRVVTESMSNMVFSAAEKDPEESIYMQYMENRDQLDDSLDSIKDIQKQDGIDHTGLKDQLKITFDIYRKIIHQAQDPGLKQETDSGQKRTAQKSPDDDFNFGNSIIEIAQDDCAELRADYAREWWRLRELEYVLQIWTQIRDALQSASDYLNQRRDALTSAAFASPDPTLTQQELVAQASERAAEGRRIARQTPVVNNALTVYSRAVGGITTERDRTRRLRQEAERLLRECEEQGNM
jgi:hypothetical protein